MKVIGIVKNNGITGIEYGVIEIAEPKQLPSRKKSEQKTKKTNNKKHNSSKNTHVKTAHVEKETKESSKPAKIRCRLRATIVCSYYLKQSKKHADLNKKRHQKNLTMFKKKQRKGKIAVQNVMQAMNFIEPIWDILVQNQKTK